MKSKQIKENILQLIECKIKTAELIDRIYHESGDICLKIYSEDPISIFVENPRGFELLSKIFKKRIMISDECESENYPIKKYFSYKDVEFFCLYKDENQKLKSEKKIKLIATTLSAMKTGFTFVLKIFKAIK